MKKLCILAVGALFAITTAVNAQAPTSRSEKKEVKKEMRKGEKPESKDMRQGEKGYKNCAQGKPQQKCCDPKQCKNGKPCCDKKCCDPKQCKNGKTCCDKKCCDPKKCNGGKPCAKNNGKETPSRK